MGKDDAKPDTARLTRRRVMATTLALPLAASADVAPAAISERASDSRIVWILCDRDRAEDAGR